jgi:hypothetical protein
MMMAAGFRILFGQHDTVAAILVGRRSKASFSAQGISND